MLKMYTVYARPRDYPDSYVVREFYIGKTIGAPTPGGIIAQAPTLDLVRQQLPAGLYCLPRSFNDDACIVETWI